MFNKDHQWGGSLLWLPELGFRGFILSLLAKKYNITQALDSGERSQIDVTGIIHLGIGGHHHFRYLLSFCTLSLRVASWSQEGLCSSWHHVSIPVSKKEWRNTKGLPFGSAALLRRFPKYLIQQLMPMYHWSEFSYTAILICRIGLET